MHLLSMLHLVLKPLMKKAIAIVCLILSGATLSAQDKCPIVKGYAYQRTTLPGTIPKGVVDEQGREVKRPAKHMVTQYFYLETRPGESFDLQRIWVKGKPYEVKMKTVEQTPVLIAKTSVGSKYRSDTLVKQTRNNVMKLNVQQPIDMKAGSKLARKIKRSDIVVEYSWNGKVLYFEIDTIKILEPLALQ